MKTLKKRKRKDAENNDNDDNEENDNSRDGSGYKSRDQEQYNEYTDIKAAVDFTMRVFYLIGENFDEVRHVVLYGKLQPTDHVDAWFWREQPNLLVKVIFELCVSRLVNLTESVNTNSILLKCFIRSGLVLSNPTSNGYTFLQLAIREKNQNLITALLSLSSVYDLNFDFISKKEQTCAVEDISRFSHIVTNMNMTRATKTKLIDEILCRTSNHRIKMCSFDIHYIIVPIILNHIFDDYDPNGYGQFMITFSIVNAISSMNLWDEQLESIKTRLRNYQTQTLLFLHPYITVYDLRCIVGQYCFHQHV